MLMGGPVSAADPNLQPKSVIAAGYGGARLQAPASVAFDTRRGELIAVNTGLRRIECFGLDGRAKARFLHPVRLADGTVTEGRPWMVAVTADSRLLVVDYQAAYVDVLDLRGRSIARFDLPGVENPLAEGPGPLAVLPDGTIVVATRGPEGRIYRFGPDYRPLGVWGETGEEPGRLSRITCLAATPDGEVVVGCSGTELAVQIFDAEGNYRTGFGVHDIGGGNFSLPSGLTVTSDGRIWAVDELRQIIQVFDAEGGYIGRVGTGGGGPGEFMYPSAIACLGDTLFAVSERVGNRIQLLVAR